MFLIISNDNSLLLETSLTLLKLPFILINSFNCLVNTISELEKKDIKQLFIVNSNTSIKKKINENIDKLLSIKESCIIGYKNNFLLENSKIDSINDFSIDIHNSFSAYNSNPKDPVYPVLEIIRSLLSKIIFLNENFFIVPILSLNIFEIRSIDFGP